MLDGKKQSRDFLSLENSRKNLISNTQMLSKIIIVLNAFIASILCGLIVGGERSFSFEAGFFGLLLGGYLSYLTCSIVVGLIGVLTSIETNTKNSSAHTKEFLISQKKLDL